MKWKTFLKKLESEGMTNFPDIAFMWKTSPVTETLDDDFVEEFYIDQKLCFKQNYEPFKEYIKNSTNKYVVSFPNLSGDTILVIPMPRKDKNYASIYDFLQNASKTQKTEFWKLATNEIKKYAKKWGKIWVSTHGLAVRYFHLRISKQPKYYGKSKLALM